MLIHHFFHVVSEVLPLEKGRDFCISPFTKGVPEGGGIISYYNYNKNNSLFDNSHFMCHNISVIK